MIVNPKQQKIMKPIYNVRILLFSLTFTSCYKDESDNSWDIDAMKIYQDFGVKKIYKDITEKDLNKNWTGGGIGGSTRVFENCLNEEMAAFYITFM